MTSDKRVSDERDQALNDLREERDRLRRELNAALESRDNCVSEIDALRAELTAATKPGLFEKPGDKNYRAFRAAANREHDALLRAEAAERERDEARAALAAIARNADDATDLSLFRVQCRDFAKSAITPTQESETP